MFLFSIGVSSLAYAQSPKFSNDFLNIGVGARAHAMSGSVISSVSDVTASYWNPSALTNVSAPFQVGAMHAEWFAGIGKYDFMSIGKSLGGENQAFGSVSIIRMAIDQIPNTLRLRDADGNINYDAIEEFSVADYAFLVSYGQRLGQSPWRVGGNVKVIHRTVGSFAKAWGFGLDASASAQWAKWRFGLMIRDISSTFNAWSFSFTEEEKQILVQTDNKVPERSVESTLPTLHTGLSYQLIERKKFTMMSEVALQVSTNGAESSLLGGNRWVVEPALGIEMGYADLVFLRLGAGNFQSVTNNVDGLSEEIEFQPSAGLGLKLGKLHIDYAFSNIGNIGTAQSSHIFSVSLNIESKRLQNTGATLNDI